MPINEPYPSYSKQFDAAVGEFWEIRRRQGSKQSSGGNADAGTRGNVTGGKHLEPLADLICSVFEDNGFNRSTIATGRKATLPGYYREQKDWDVVVLHGETVVAVVELKSQSKSFGNNLNNRIEEAVGQTSDFWMAHKHNLIPGLRPWFGYLMLVEDHPKSRKSVKPSSSLIPKDPAFAGASYLERYATAFERLVVERQLDAVCFAATGENSAGADFPTPAMTFDHFAGMISDRCRQIINTMGPPPGE